MAEFKLKYTGRQIEEALDAAKAALPTTGGAMTGPLALEVAPTSETHAATKGYVDGKISEIALTPGGDGASAFEIAQDNGFVGSEAEWLESLKGKEGKNGKSAYEIAKENNFTGSEAEWLESLKGQGGAPGKTAYEYAQDGGYAGTEDEFAADLGKVGSGGGSSAWADIDGNPFVRPITGSVQIDGSTLRWDGDTEGMIISTAQGRDVAFVSDNVPPWDKIRDGIDIVWFNKDLFANYTYKLRPELGTTESTNIINLAVNIGDSGLAWAWIVKEPGYSSAWGVSFERAGIYFVLSDAGYIKEFKALNFEWAETKEKIALPIPPIPQSYMPEFTEMIMVSPAGKKFRITIDASGNFVPTEL